VQNTVASMAPIYKLVTDIVILHFSGRITVFFAISNHIQTKHQQRVANCFQALWLKRQNFTTKWQYKMPNKSLAQTQKNDMTVT